MKTTTKYSVLVLILLSLNACLKPDPIENDTLVDISFMDLMETQAYARDVVAHESKVFVAASQAGNQIWETSGDAPTKVFDHFFSSNPALRVTVEPETRLLFAFDKTQGFHKTLNPELTAFDSVYIKHSIWISLYENGLFGSGANEDFAARKLNDSLVALYVIDRTSNDGLKQYFFNRGYDSFNGFYYWELVNAGVSTGGINLGLDLRDSLLAISHDELGIGVYRLDGVALDTLATVNTEGEALEVSFYDNYILSANNWAGMGVYALDEVQETLTHIADVEVGGWVKQISLWNDVAVLACGENSIFLVDLSDPAHPKVDQWIDAGYTYRTFIQDDVILAATREGVKRYRIEPR